MWRKRPEMFLKYSKVFQQLQRPWPLGIIVQIRCSLSRIVCLNGHFFKCLWNITWDVGGKTVVVNQSEEKTEYVPDYCVVKIPNWCYRTLATGGFSGIVGYTEGFGWWHWPRSHRRLGRLHWVLTLTHRYTHSCTEPAQQSLLRFKQTTWFSS